MLNYRTWETLYQPTRICSKIQILQSEGKIPSGKIGFSPLKAVGTDCIHGDEEDFIQLDIKNFKN
jgi:hypothetical protein